MTHFNNQDSRDRSSPSVPPQTIPAQTIDSQKNIDSQIRLADQRRYEAEHREESNTLGGLLFGMLLTAVVGLGVGAYYFLNNQRPSTTTIITPAPVASPSPQVKERIIERDRLVPIPQQSSAPAPNVNVTLPNPAPAPQSAPTAQPAPEQRVPASSPAPVAPAGQ
jgi:hypothetical protein